MILKFHFFIKLIKNLIIFRMVLFYNIIKNSIIFIIFVTFILI